jgi:hypothetical protein
MLEAPDQSTQTTLTSGSQAANTAYLMGTFTTAPNTTDSTIIIPGLWDLNLWATSDDDTDKVQFYYSIFYVTANGVTETLIAAGSSAASTPVYTGTNLYSASIYVPQTTLPDLSYRLRVKIYAVFVGPSNHSLSVYFRNSTVSHLHTTLLANQATGPTGAAGATGVTGATGPSGAAGLQGLRDQQVLQGLQEPQGWREPQERLDPAGQLELQEPRVPQAQQGILAT